MNITLLVASQSSIFWQIPSFETPLPTRSKTNIPVARLEFQCLFDRPAEAAQFVGW